MAIATSRTLKLAALVVLLLATTFGVFAQTQTQTPLPGSSIPQFVDPLPVIPALNGTDGTEITLTMSEFRANVLPSTIVLPGGPYQGTTVWGYRTEPGGVVQGVQETYVGPVVIAQRGIPTRLRFVNNLGSTGTTNLLAYKNSTDQTLHWADPLGLDCAHMGGMLPMGDCARNYDGPIPAAVHLHGGEVPASLDGGPDSWFTSFGGFKGHAYYSADGAADNEVIYTYPNTQESAPIWFHDHTLGATRLNVYAGLAGAYLVTDPPNDPTNLPELVPLVIQDRMFDTNGELFYPAGVPYIPNPDHPYWVPEFVGDTIIVNGKAWPYLNVEAKRYRFIIINGSNARTYEMFLTNPVTKVNGPAIYQIGTDGGFLDSPVKIDPNVAGFNKLVMMPGERAEIIIDFRAYAGQTLIIKNTAKTPYPAGATPNGSTVAKIIQFRVAACPAGGCAPDPSYNPSTGAPVRTKPMVRLVNAATGKLQTGISPTVTRQLTLNEVMGMPMTVGGITYPGGPLEILLNNTKWMTAATETPNEGEIEVWEIVNLTADAHPIHLHLTQFQLLNRQNFDAKKYTSAYNLAFPTKLFQPGFGPPSDYNTPNADRAVGGNPAVTPFLKSAAKAPNPNEAGWKDTVLALPGQVTRIAVRFAPTDAPTTTVAGDLYFPFDPSAGGHGYVWHCHIVDHEDNEMMRPTFVNANSTAVRSFVFGVDY